MCGMKVFFTDADTGERRFTKWYCRKATCPTCKERRTDLMTAVLYDYIKGRSCWHMTLTVRHKPSPLRPLVTGIHEAFKELRESACWHNQIIGGARFFELTHDVETGTWGPHIHALVEAAAIDFMPIKARWLKLTEDGFQTHRRRIEDTHDGRLNAIYYVTQPPFETFVDDRLAMAEYRMAMKRLNPARAFGDWHNLKLLPRDRNSSKEP